MIFGGCAVIFVGVAGGYHSPLSAVTEVSGTDTNTAAEPHTAALLALPVKGSPQSHY